MPASLGFVLARPLLIAVGVACCTWVSHWPGHAYGVQPTFIAYFSFVLLVAAIWGTSAGLWATILSAFAADYFFLRPVGWFAIDTIGDRVGIGLFVVVSIAVSLTAGSLRRYRANGKSLGEKLRHAENLVESERRSVTEAQLRLSAIVESSDDAIIAKDTHGIITSWNDGAQRMFGYTAAEVIGESIRCIIPPGREQEEDEILQQLLHSQHVQNFDTVRVTKAGRAIQASVTVSPIRDASGKIVGVSKIARDITETKNLQRQLQQSQKMETVGQLTGGVAHDFNNLLAIIIAALDLQHSSIVHDPIALKCWTRAHDAALRSADLTRRLLDFSSMEQLKSVPVQLHVSIANVLALARPSFGPEIQTTLAVDDSIPPVLADPGGLESALLNLFINARDAMPRGGTLTVSSRVCSLDLAQCSALNPVMMPGSYVCLSVADSGKGMSSEVLERAFEPFFTTKASGRGTGLGLPMVHGFARQSHGGVNLHSEPGQGTTVSIYLPFAPAGAAVPVLNVSIPAPGKGTVLIVDDEDDLLELGVHFLQGLGYTALSAPNARTALKLFKDHPIVDVLITDVVMGGGMDGMELARHVHGLKPDTKIVYSSGVAVESLSSRSRPLTGSLVLQKPYRLAELAAIVHQAIGNAEDKSAMGAGRNRHTLMPAFSQEERYPTSASNSQ